VKRRPPIDPPFGPSALANDVTVLYSLHHGDVALMRLRSSLVLDPNLFGLQELDCRDVALIVAAVVMVPTPVKDARGILARRQLQAAHVDLRERRHSWECRHPTNDAVVRGTDPPKLRTTFRSAPHIHRLSTPADKVASVADEIGFLIGEFPRPGCGDFASCGLPPAARLRYF
jgi:hypothetical protein